MPSILIIDDEEELLDLTKMYFEAIGFTVFTAISGEDALKSIPQNHPQVLLIDYRLPGISGLDVLKAARAMDPKCLAIMITGLTDRVEELEAQCKQVGISAFLQKPLQMEQVSDAVKNAVKGSSA